MSKEARSASGPSGRADRQSRIPSEGDTRRAPAGPSRHRQNSHAARLAEPCSMRLHAVAVLERGDKPRQHLRGGPPPEVFWPALEYLGAAPAKTAAASDRGRCRSPWSAAIAARFPVSGVRPTRPICPGSATSRRSPAPSRVGRPMAPRPSAAMRRGQRLGTRSASVRIVTDCRGSNRDRRAPSPCCNKITRRHGHLASRSCPRRDSAGAWVAMVMQRSSVNSATPAWPPNLP